MLVVLVIGRGGESKFRHVLTKPLPIRSGDKSVVCLDGWVDGGVGRGQPAALAGGVSQLPFRHHRLLLVCVPNQQRTLNKPTHST